MEVNQLTSILTALLILAGIVAVAYLVLVLVRVKTLLENLNKAVSEVNSRLPSILENLDTASKQLADVTGKAHSQFEVLENFVSLIQSYVQKARNIFSGDSPPLELPSGLFKIFALIKAIRAVISRLKV